jgi:hypothetical protein
MNDGHARHCLPSRFEAADSLDLKAGLPGKTLADFAKITPSTPRCHALESFFADASHASEIRQAPITAMRNRCKVVWRAGSTWAWVDET